MKTFRKSTVVLLAFALWAIGLAYAGPAAAAGDPSNVSFTLEGCRNNGTITLPNGAGKFICPNAAYTSGNLGKGWNELDLVPFRVTMDAGNSAPATQTYTIAVVLDSKKGGNPGYDVLSQPQLNTALSAASCTAPTVGPEVLVSPGLGGVDESRYRLVTITQARNTTCVYDYYGRLALGSHLFPGASLHANLANQTLGTQGVGSKEVSIPVNEIGPQELAKDMAATQNSDHAWDITKSPTPATVSFKDTCDPQAARKAGVSITVTWEKKAAVPSGPITVITHVYATNPAHRAITTSVADDIRSGTTVLDTASSLPVNVPANTANFLVLTHQTTVPDGTTGLNDIATATYTDPVTGVAVPGQTTATASALVQPSGIELNQSATINDLEGITGAGFQYSADSFTPATIGAFDGFYFPGTPTNGQVSWTSDPPQSASGTVTFDKTIYVDSGTSSTGTLADTAKLTGSDGFTATTQAGVDLSASAFVSLTITKQIPDVLQGTESQAFTFQVKDANGIVVEAPSVTFAAGETSKSVTVGGLLPGTYTVSEDPAAGWEAQPDQTVPINLPTCSGSATFKNAVKPAHAAAVKITDPAGSENGWEMTLTGPGTPAGGEKLLTDATGHATFTTALQEGAYTIDETLKSGWERIGSTGDCQFSVNYPADATKTFTCTITNRKLGSITVKKVTQPAGDPATFAFTGDLSGTIGDGGQIGPKEVSAGTYTTTEAVPAGWDLKSITCTDPTANSSGVTATATATFTVAPGENAVCTYTDVKRGSITVKKVTDPAGDSATFAFAGDLTGSISGGQQIGPKSVAPGTYTTTETVPAGWDLKSITCSDTDSSGVPSTAKTTFTVAAGEDVACTYTDVKRGMAQVIKTVQNVPPSGTQAFTFQLRQNATTMDVGTTLDTQVANAANGGIVTFAPKLVPGTTYQLCEIVMPGWTTSLGTFVPASFMPPDGVAANPNVDNSILCINFTVAAGETKPFAVNNTPPPGGRALTIGFWKNWSSCTGGGQKPVLDQTLASFATATGQTTHGVFIGKLYVDTCAEAVAILNKSDVVTGKKMASDPAYNLAAQLLATELNFQAQAGRCPAAVTAEQQAQTLLSKYSFNGTGSYTAGVNKLSAADTTLANQLAQKLDAYNNDRLC